MLPRGRVLGGTSTINSMTWARASKQDFDALVELGNPGWGWDDWLPYMLKSEALHPSTDQEADANLATFDAKHHSSSGPIHLSFAPWVGATHQPFFKALNSLGVNNNPDSVCYYLRERCMLHTQHPNYRAREST
jgi:choline dehydrogenase-like flavoprotein